MSGRARMVQVHFDGQKGRPVAASRKPTPKGRRVLVKIDDYDPSSQNVFVLHHAKVHDVIIAASSRRQSIERVLARCGAGADYEIISIPVLDAAG